MTLAIDGGFVFHSRAQLQSAADAMALAAIGELRAGETPERAVRTAVSIAAEHRVGESALSVATTDVQYGTWDTRSGTFSPGSGGAGVAAFRTFARRSSGSQSGALRLLFGDLLGIPTADLESAAVATVRRRDILIVQDATYSFRDEFSAAIDADLALVASMAGTLALPGDRVGVTRFTRYAYEHLPLTELASNANQVLQTLRDLPNCQRATAAGGCNGTGTSDAIELGRQIFARDTLGDDAEKVMVLLTDGVPCHSELGSPRAMVRVGKEEATRSANSAAEDGINIFAITLAIRDGNHLCQIPDPEFTNSLARGFGIGIDTPHPDDLDDILVSIVKRMPIRLVR